MLYTEDNIISITRGDDATLEINMETSDGDPYVMGSEDMLTLTVREIPCDGSPVLLAVSSAPGSNRIVLHGTDTADICPGRYSYDVQLNLADGNRYTVLPALDEYMRSRVVNWRNFVIMPEVTIP